MRGPHVILPFVARVFRFFVPVCALLLAAPALAQVPLQGPPLVQAVDRNGVDLLVGGLERREIHATVGGQGAQGLAEFAFDAGSITMNYGVSLPRGWAGSNVMTANVALGGVSYNFDRFVSSSNAFVDSRKTGGVLKFDTGPFAFIFTDKDGTIYRFSARYTLTPSEVVEDQTDRNVATIDSITYPTGEVVTFYYSDTNYLSVSNGYRLQSVVSSLGYQLKYEYASDDLSIWGWTLVNKVRAINMAYDTCDPAAAHCSSANAYPVSTYGRNYDQNGTGGQPYVFTYDDAMLRRTTDIGTATHMIIRPSGASKAVVDEYNSYVKYNMITSVSDGVGTWAYQFTPVNGVVTVTDPVQHATTYNYDKRKGVTKVTDAQGRQTLYAYDLSARLITAEFPEGNGVIYTRDDRNNVTQTGYYAKGSGGAPSITMSAGYDATCTLPKTCNQPRYTIDARGTQTDYTYDDNHGGVLTKTLPAGPNGIRPTVTYAYQQFYAWYRNAAGVLIQAATPAYRLVSESACQTQATCAGTADEVRTVYAYGAPGTPNNLQVTSKTVQSGDSALVATTSFTYTPAGDVKTVDGPMPDDTVTYFYNAARQKLGEVSPDPDGAGPLKRRATRTTYNAGGLPGLVEQGTVEGATDADWANFAPLMGSATVYDAREHKIQDSLVSGGVAQTLNQYSYDTAGRLICSAQRMNPAAFPSSSAWACAAGTEGLDGADRITVNTYDEVDRVIAVTHAYNTPRSRTEWVSFTPNGQKQTDADGKGNLTTYEYDGYDRLVKVRYPSVTCCTSSTTDYEAYGYDNAGNRTSWRRRSGETIAYTYDALNRLGLEDLPGSWPDVAHSYDNLGRQTAASSNGSATTTLYDVLGRVTRQTGPVMSGLNYTTLSEYDLAGRRTRLVYPDGNFVTYKYDAAGEMTEIWESGSTKLVSYIYDNLGRRVSVANANGTGQAYGYDTASRLNTLGHDLAGTGQDQVWTYGYNAANQVRVRTSSNSGTYDWTGGQPSKTYGVNGLNQMTSISGAAIAYDPRGNLASEAGSTYSYDLLNRLISTSQGQLTYDPSGRLMGVSPVNGVIPTNFAYDGINVLAEYTGTAAAWQMLRRYVPGPGVDEPVILYEGAGLGDKHWLMADPQGSIVSAADASGAAAYINTYNEYGIAGSNNDGRFQYTGQAWIPELGLYYYKARFYSPNHGRFLQTDPTGYDDGLNWYAYVGNDPVNGDDPTGLEAKFEGMKECFMCSVWEAPSEGGGGQSGKGGGQSAWGSYWKGVGERNAAQGVRDEVEGRTQTADGLTLLSMATAEVSLPLQLVRGASAAAAPLVTNNRIAGNAARDVLAVGLRAEGRVAATEVYKWTPFGKRFIDIEVSLGGKVLGGIEVKVGGSRYMPAQRAKDTWLWLTQGYRVNVVRIPR
jgi:RHS repeat-associated protein